MAIPRSQPTPPAGRSRRAVRVLVILLLLAGLVGGGWYFIRLSNRSQDQVAALKLVTERKYAEAIPALRQCLEEDPDNPVLLEGLVASLMKSGALVVEVEPVLDRLCALRPDDLTALRLRLDLRQKLGRKDDALADALRILELSPQDHAVRRTAAGLAVELGQREIAERELTTLQASGPYPPHEIGTLLARLHWEAARFAEAEAILDRDAPPSVQFAPARALRGVLHFEAGRFESAQELLNPVAAGRGPEAQFARYYLALTLTRLGKKTEADQVFARLEAAYRAERMTEDAQQRADDLPAQVQAARANLVADRPEVGRDLLEAALKRHSPNREALRVLADCYDKLNRADLGADARRHADTVPK